MTLYGLHGLRLRSEVPLAGFPVTGHEFDVDIGWGPVATVPAAEPPGEVVAARARDDGYWYVASEAGGQTVLRVPGMCDFLVAPGAASVECRPDPSVDPAVVGLLVSGLVVAFLLGLRGDLVLHASAVEVGGSAVALAGCSGAGKSTLAAVLCAAGAKLVTDDVLRVVSGPAGVRSVGGTPHLRLRPHASWVVEGFASPQAVSTTADDRLGVAPAASLQPSLPLGAVALVRPSRSATNVEIADVAASQAVLRLAAVLRVGGWAQPAVRRRHFDALAGMARSVRVVEAVVPWGPPLAPDVAPVLLALAGTGRRPPGPAGAG